MGYASDESKVQAVWPQPRARAGGPEGLPGARPDWVRPTVLAGPRLSLLTGPSLSFRLTAPKIPEGEKVDFDVS